MRKQRHRAAFYRRQRETRRWLRKVYPLLMKEIGRDVVMQELMGEVSTGGTQWFKLWVKA